MCSYAYCAHTLSIEQQLLLVKKGTSVCYVVVVVVVVVAVVVVVVVGCSFFLTLVTRPAVNSFSSNTFDSSIQPHCQFESTSHIIYIIYIYAYIGI